LIGERRSAVVAPLIGERRSAVVAALIERRQRCSSRQVVLLLSCE
jgi:hypothetical protein